jgi:hypothetical protein
MERVANCDHKGLSAYKFYWMRGTFYIMCRRCGADLRNRVDESALSKMN